MLLIIAQLFLEIDSFELFFKNFVKCIDLNIDLNDDVISENLYKPIVPVNVESLVTIEIYDDSDDEDIEVVDEISKLKPEAILDYCNSVIFGDLIKPQIINEEVDSNESIGSDVNNNNNANLASDHQPENIINIVDDTSDSEKSDDSDSTSITSDELDCDSLGIITPFIGNYHDMPYLSKEFVININNLEFGKEYFTEPNDTFNNQVLFPNHSNIVTRSQEQIEKIENSYKRKNGKCYITIDNNSIVCKM